ncbi:UDP-4-amino-4,6-dideoxy-N-acetyl-beta-L-altrosamine N-acetyltransferase [Helicobacter ibis]|uniref:UDP-4-amino-4, 6-dideoxy-N-acetyl-beta-L-altrosamine N-acetyltransferase n=1 Tax=Helicobacter ibis TaxID=2962633 RepID=A0ABT4VFA3_9HELI|nr:UDP-4-amino-4,6-dideoxy-N-acetyl-beta-L-altrosamine N-acetyltransferase [Helicobacter ibis]MDA3969391.1 UDP-4-amino-4,6-dideoxy-N-acetyl-beta-L-altrosamine N-acetyltransferase [Helicobacter ibis]
MRNKTILIVVAHPDDEVLGCFGTIARMIKEGHRAYTLVLGEGKSSRAVKRSDITQESYDILDDEFYKANKSIGISEVFRERFPDNAFDSVPLLEIIKSIEKIKQKTKPDIIFTHYESDLNIDHKITFQAVLTATRPMRDECVREIYSFEVLSSTEWKYPHSFSPNVFFDISDTLELKINAMNLYKSELCEYPHPRSLTGIELNAKYRGLQVGLSSVESFMLIRLVNHCKIEFKSFSELDINEIAIIFAWRNDARVCEFMKTKNFSWEIHNKFIESLKDRKDKEYFLVYSGDVAIGVVYFVDINSDSCEFGIYANPNLKGYGKILMQHLLDYAKNTLKVKTLYSSVYTKNKRALKLYESFGFEIQENKEMSFVKLDLSAGGGGLLSFSRFNLSYRSFRGVA